MLCIVGFAALATVLGSPAAAAPPSCSKCTDLNKYLQRIKDMELTRDLFKKNIPGEPNYVGPVRSVEDLVRNVNGDMCEAVGGCSRTTGTSVRAELTTTVPDCVIRFNDKPLDKAAEAEYRALQCTPFADAAIAHERSHKAFCEFTNKGGWEHDFEDPAMHAADEVVAYNIQIKMLRQSMRKLAKKCKWQPTTAQQSDANSIPSEKQIEGMIKRSVRAAKALAGGRK